MTDFVMGPTIMTRRGTATDVPFPTLARGEDTGFLRAVVAAGATVYSADRYNFMQVRRAEPSVHTWAVTESELLASADVQVFGVSTAHMMF
ncbi:hypothetical protein [Cellulomonas sp. ATA003]|uniref:hypothetical protein n=1 Tax=Cellulomonas sp. ATA003 TaxID=3073064 RepID=UPI0028739F86|nr:hypothetical protein [Cellulomonas sp. ATA003]WNB85203.1 hypothetical protein REH70_16430 [Cellulomonas sp. ATA003]